MAGGSNSMLSHATEFNLRESKSGAKLANWMQPQRELNDGFDFGCHRATQL